MKGWYAKDASDILEMFHNFTRRSDNLIPKIGVAV